MLLMLIIEIFYHCESVQFFYGVLALPFFWRAVTTTKATQLQALVHVNFCHYAHIVFDLSRRSFPDKVFRLNSDPDFASADGTTTSYIDNATETTSVVQSQGRQPRT